MGRHQTRRVSVACCLNGKGSAAATDGALRSGGLYSLVCTTRSGGLAPGDRRISTLRQPRKRRGRLRLTGERPDPGRAMPGLKKVAVEVGDPLLAFRRQLQIADGVADIGLDLQREEIGEDRAEIGGGLAAELFHHPDLRKLGIQRRQLAMIEGVSELADQVRCPDQRWLGVGDLVGRIVRHRKSRHLDRLDDAFLVDKLRGCKTLTGVDLGAVDMIRRKHRVGGAARWRVAVAGLVDDKAVLGVALADAVHHTDVVDKQRAGEMQPVIGGQGFRKQPTADDLLTGERNHQRMLNVVIERVRIADALQDKARRPAHVARIFRIAVREILEIELRQIVAESVGHDGDRIEHDSRS